MEPTPEDQGGWQRRGQDGAPPTQPFGTPTPPHSGYPPYATPGDPRYPAPAYPPPPEYYRVPPWQTPPSPPAEWGAPSVAEQRRCAWCGALSPAGNSRCLQCGAVFPAPNQPRYWEQPSTGAYPQYAPNGRVDPHVLQQTESSQGKRAGGGTAIGVGSAVIAGVSKFGILAKFALPLASALASVGIYALLFGWRFAVGLVALLFVHEMGHVLVIRAKGLPASLPVFIPLLGAAVLMRRMPLNVRDEAEIAIAGPLAGALAGGVCYALYFQTDYRLWLALAYFSFFLNLFNLIPVSPLDGGRVAGAISRWIWPLGIVALVVLFFYTHSIIILIVGWLGFFQTLTRFRQAAKGNTYYQMNLASRGYITVLYFGLAIALALAMLDAQQLLAGGSPIFGS
jgi:Zn-dependent protease